MAYEDLLKDTAQYVESGDYYLLTITDLDINTSYPIQFRWKYKDGTFGTWSASKTITTPGESFPAVPSTLTVTGGSGILTIQWDGKDSLGNNLTNFDRLDIYIDGSPFDGTKATASLYGAGTKTIVAPAGTYIVAAYAVSKAGTRSSVNTPVTRTVTSVVPSAASSVTPSTPTVISVLGAIQLSWNGKTSTGGDQPYGFDAAKVYVGTSSGFTPSSSNQVDTLNFANGQNTLNIGVGTVVNGTPLDYGIDYYIKIATTNGTDTSTAVSASGNPVRIGQVKSGDIVTVTADKIATGTLSSSSTITVGSATGKHVTLAGTGDPLTIYDTDGTTKLLSYSTTSGKLSIVGDGSFTGNLSIGSSNAIFKAEPATGIWLGDATYLSAPFSVSTNGVLKANSGTVGGWTLGSDYLSTTNFKISKADATIYVGNTSGQHFRISSSELAHYNSGSTTGAFTLTTSNGNLVMNGQISTGSVILGKDVSGTNDGIYINSNNYWYDTGNFKVGGVSSNVSWDGTNLNVTGTISASSGSRLGDWYLGSTYISSTNGVSSGYYIKTDGTASFATLNATGFQMVSSGAITMGLGTISGASTIEGNYLTANTEIYTPSIKNNSGSLNLNSTTTYTAATTAAGSTLVLVDTGKRIGYVSSSRKTKKNISLLQIGGYTDLIKQLNLVSFDWKNQPEDMPYRKNYGLIAEDVAELNNELESLVNYNENNEPVSITYDRLVIFLSAAIKELSARLDALEG